MKYNDIITNPKDSYIYRKTDIGFHATMKGLNVYKDNQHAGYKTPTGSQPSHVMFFYKHQIPSGLFIVIKLENIEASIQKDLAELKQLM